MRQERGQTAAEYMGVLLLVAVIAGGVSRAVCAIAQQQCGGDAPRHTPAGPGARSTTVDSDGDGLLDGDDPVPAGADVDLRALRAPTRSGLFLNAAVDVAGRTTGCPVTRATSRRATRTRSTAPSCAASSSRSRTRSGPARPCATRSSRSTAAAS